MCMRVNIVWIGQIGMLQSQDVIQETDDFHARLYVLQAAKADYSDWLVAFMTHENVEIRRDAVFYLGMLHHVADYQAVLVQGLQDEDEIVVLYSLSSLGKVKDKGFVAVVSAVVGALPERGRRDESAYSQYSQENFGGI